MNTELYHCILHPEPHGLYSEEYIRKTDEELFLESLYESEPIDEEVEA